MSSGTHRRLDLKEVFTKKEQKMKLGKLSLAAVAIIGLTASAQAALKSDKITLKPNMMIKYNKLPAPVDNIKDAFTEGMFYGRIRMNAFNWDWKDESYKTGGKTKDNHAMGIGASLIYKSAPLAGVSGTLGLYTSQNPNFANMDKADVKFVKAGKDTFSRDDVTSTNHYGLTVVAQAYLQYDIGKTTIIGGRQMFESVFTASNDTKMIPNTFDGGSVTIKDIPKTTISLAYFTAQKLRDHATSHDVLAFGAGTSGGKWSENDDAAVNKSLTVARIGDSNKLIIGSVTNKSIKNLKVNVSGMMVPDVVSNLTLQAFYTIPVGEKWKIIPGVRYMQQFDNLGANYGVANLKAKATTGNARGYNDVTSLDTSLLALRLDIKNGAFLGRLGYSHIADKADIIAPWRGFATGGFTRAMAQYNWYANTTTYMARVGYDFDKENIIPGFSAMLRYAIQDFDDVKTAAGSVQSDSNVIHLDLRQHVSNDLELKFRMGLVDAKADKDSYNEYRVELNYFF